MTDTDVLPQYSLTKILAIWAAAAIPMPVLAFWVAPRLSEASGLHPGIAIWGMLIPGMIWQFVLSCLLLRAEAGGLRRGNWTSRIWLQAPRDPATGKPRLRLLWWTLPARRYRSIWFALIPHGIEGLFVLRLVLGLVSGALV